MSVSCGHVLVALIRPGGCLPPWHGVAYQRSLTLSRRPSPGASGNFRAQARLTSGPSLLMYDCLVRELREVSRGARSQSVQICTSGALDRLGSRRMRLSTTAWLCTHCRDCANSRGTTARRQPQPWRTTLFRRTTMGRSPSPSRKPVARPLAIGVLVPRARQRQAEPNLHAAMPEHCYPRPLRTKPVQTSAQHPGVVDARQRTVPTRYAAMRAGKRTAARCDQTSAGRVFTALRGESGPAAAPGISAAR